MLKVENLSVRFGGIVALDSISLKIQPGTFCGIIGPNGAGKTTLFNAIFRIAPIAAGDILINGRSLLALKPSEVVQTGIARTFQNLGIFPSLTVGENIIAGGLSRHRVPLIADVLGLSVAADPRRQLCMRARDIAALCGLDGLYGCVAGALPFGIQKRIELARALAAEPSVLLLDEPAGGLSHREVDEFLALLTKIKAERALTIVMIEHHLGLVMRITEHVIVLNFGRKIADGPPYNVRNNADVIAAYLGTHA